MTEPATSPGRQSILLRRLLFLVFAYAGLAYGGSLLEYTLFNLTGKSIVTPERHYTTITKDELVAEFQRCGGPLFGATGQTTAPNEPMLARCGRYWPFYRHTIELPANPLIPGAFVVTPQESPEARDARESFMSHVSIINGGFALVAALVVGITLMGVYRFVVQKDEEAGYRLTFKAFVSSFLMLAAYTGLMLFVDPTFSMGW
ncbi:hypothetical protein AAIA72_11165 [Hahella sp. SMD15-11]|uniref:DUF3592 domain-containing protein n=1 Tax=Thermohahella caldifontis TaxID=3142973 RepID=A0AB39USZ9_9GAMM